MDRTRFHKRREPTLLKEIAETLGVSLRGDGEKLVHDIAALDLANEGHLSFLDNSKYLYQVKNTRAGAVIISEENAEHLPAGVSALISDMPYATYSKVLQMFYPMPETTGVVSAKADVSADAEIGENVQIDAFAVVKNGAKIGDNCIVRSGAVIGENAAIGAFSIIDSGAVIQCATLGRGCIVHPNASIGQDGFGFAWDGKAVQKVPQIGSVVIGDLVEIGAGTTIDRGSLGDTVIGDMTKIDNLVQIAHNVKIGRGCQIVAQAGVAGSTELGDGVIVGGQAGFAGHLKVADRVMVSAKTGVTKNITEVGITLGGFPAVPIEKWRRMQVALGRLVTQKKG